MPNISLFLKQDQTLLEMTPELIKCTQNSRYGGKMALVWAFYIYYMIFKQYFQNISTAANVILILYNSSVN